LSSGIIAALKYLTKYNSTGFANAQATIEYLEFMHDFFKLHNVSDRTQDFKQLDPKCAPYINISDERLTWLTEILPNYIYDIQKDSKNKKSKGLTSETTQALVFTAQSTSECVKYLLHESNFYFLLTRAFSSDPVETMFSNVRMGGGLHDVTDARTAHYALKQGSLQLTGQAAAGVTSPQKTESH
jgi:hypothetical protein